MYDFADREHAANYLNGTIVRWKSYPTMVQAVDGTPARLQIHHWLLRDNKSPLINKLSEFDLKPMRLGMFNFMVDGVIVEAAWIQRVAARRWKVGLDKAGMSVVPVRQTGDNIVHELMRDRQGMPWYGGSAMADMLEGHYPTYAEALELIGQRTRCSVAFCRDFAIVGGDKIAYRHNAVPVGKAQEHYPVLFEQYRDLREMLEEELQ